MDSVSQLALGAAVGVAVMGRRTAVWKAALWGAVAGTLPDLDVFFDYGDAIRNMTQHRSHSHALFWLTLGAPVLATETESKKNFILKRSMSLRFIPTSNARSSIKARTTTSTATTIY